MTNIQPITEDITGLQAANIIFENDTALRMGQLFNPPLQKEIYDSAVTAQTAGAGQAIRVTPEGYKEVYTAAGSNPNSGSVGYRSQFLEAGYQYFFKAIVKFSGFDNPVSENSHYFIYYEGATINIQGLSKLTDLGGGRYLYERTLSPLTVDGSLSFFGAQTTAASAGSIAAANSIIVESVSVVRLNEKSGVSSDLANSIIEYLNVIPPTEPIQIESDDYYGQALQNAVLSSDKKGLTAPAGQPFDPSFIQASFNIEDVNELTRVKLFFRLSEMVGGLQFFMLLYNPNGPSGRFVSYYTPVSEGGDLYSIEYTIEPNPDNTGFVSFAIQQTTPTAPTIPFYVRFENLRFWQLFGYEEGKPSFQQNAIQELINKTVDQVAGNTVTTIIVSADPTDVSAAFTGPNAVQLAIDSITDNSPSKRYRIFVKDGLYKITNSSQFIGNIGYPAMVMMKAHVDVEGQSMDGVVLWAELPYNDGDIDTAVPRVLHQTMWNMVADANVSNLRMVAKNIRYVLHQDNPGTQNSKRNYENVDMQFIGDKGGLNVYGLGTWTGEKNYVKGGRAWASVGTPFACHNNTAFAERSEWHLKNFAFISGLNNNAIALQNAGSKLNDIFEIEGCTFGGFADTIQSMDLWLTNQGGNDYYNHADYRIIGAGNAPFLFDNALAGASLRIRTLATGAGQSVRFVAASSAFPLVIPEARLKQADIFIPSLGIKDGYMYQDGSPGLAAQALGCKDISYNPALYDEGVAYQSFGRRLGDCSTVNKTLGIQINATTYNVVFDKNYSALSLATILAEINAVIGAVAVADIYSAGSMYYPILPDVVEMMYNDSPTIFIPKGTIVQRTTGRTIVPCTDPRNYYGVALEDIPVFTNTQGVITGQGRILKRGYIDTAAAPFFVRTTKQAVYGDRFTINNGVLNFDANGVIRTVRDGVVAIGC